jgi:prepilin signal peptidase PulO-like enzyme (type II secretory pathway)
MASPSANLPAVAAPSADRPRRIPLETLAAGTAPILAAVALGRYGISGEGIFAAAFCVVLVAVSVVDLRERRIPNKLIVPAVAAALTAHVFLHPERMLEWILAASGAALFFLIPNLASSGSVGMGDVKLAFLLGAVLGKAVLVALLLGTVGASLVAVALLVRRGAAARKQSLAYGPFLALGAVVVVLTEVAPPF